MRSLRMGALALTTLLLAACATPAGDASTQMDVPAQFKEQALWQTVQPTAAPPAPDAWWTLFGDATLDALETQVAVGNANLQASVAQMRVAQASLAAAEAGRWPTLGAGLSASRSRAQVGTGSRSVAAVDNSVALSASASWEVDLWGRLSQLASSAQARYDASRADLAAATLSTQATLAQTYFALRTAEAQLALFDRTVQGYERSLQVTRNRYAAGVVSAADVAQAQSQLQSAQAAQLEAATQRAQLEHAIAVLLGRPPASFTLAPGALPERTPGVPALLPAALLQRRPDIAAAQWRVAAANANIGAARAAYFPTLTLAASGGYRGTSLSDLVSAPNLFWSLGPAVALTLFDGGGRRAATDQAVAQADLAAATYRQTVLTALQEVEDNLVAAANLRREGQIQTEAVASARRAQQIVENQYKAGTVAYQNVVSAQITTFTAERTLLDARNRELAAVNQLLKNIAGRWDAAPAAAK
ncbi:MAG: efflux transporter outer membrane subunit [Betaproteobacteria bacterium]|nr:efflux transporter outer membrane subunit [Betaproteobacteria bacterium]